MVVSVLNHPFSRGTVVSSGLPFSPFITLNTRFRILAAYQIFGSERSV